MSSRCVAVAAVEESAVSASGVEAMVVDAEATGVAMEEVVAAVEETEEVVPG